MKLHAKGLFRTAAGTLLPAAAILLAGALLLTGVQALLPDGTDGYRVYPASAQSLLPLPEDAGDPVLYPWNEMTRLTEERGEDWVDEVALSEMLSLLGVPYEAFTYGGGEIFCNELCTLIGVRKLELLIREEKELYAPDTDGVAVSEVTRYLLSFALRERKEGAELCFCRLEKADPEAGADGSALQEAQNGGYAALCALASDPYTEDNPFYAFLLRYGETADCFSSEADAGDLLPEALESGPYSSFLYEGMGYFCYTTDRCVLTLLCDPVAGCVVGFSLERF